MDNDEKAKIAARINQMAKDAALWNATKSQMVTVEVRESVLNTVEDGDWTPLDEIKIGDDIQLNDGYERGTVTMTEPELQVSVLIRNESDMCIEILTVNIASDQSTVWVYRTVDQQYAELKDALFDAGYPS